MMQSDAVLIERLGADGLEPMEPLLGKASVAASTDDLWNAISEAGNLVNIHPFCERNDVVRWDGARSFDHVHYYSGVHYQREFLDWFDGVGYDLVLGPPEARTALVRWRIAESPGSSDSADSPGCEFSIKVVALLRDDVPVAQRDRYADKMIRGALPPYLDSVVRGAAHFAETGTPVQRNQFGTHPIYSPT